MLMSLYLTMFFPSMEALNIGKARIASAAAAVTNGRKVSEKPFLA